MALSRDRQALSRSTVLPIARGMEFLWLLAVGGVPLVFAPSDSLTFPNQIPKVTLLRGLVGLMVMLWILEWGINGRLRPQWSRKNAWTKFRGWLQGEPARWVVVAAAIFLAVNILSTLFSASFQLSLWGKEPAADGYALYNVASYFLLFIIIATHLKTRAQLWRLLGVILASGFLVGLYGSLQYFNLDPFNVVTAGRTRVPSTLGNPLFAAAFLLLSIPLSLAAAIMAIRGLRPSLGTIGWIGIIGVQAAALLFTLGRGGLVGLVFALLLFWAMAWLTMGKAAFARAFALVAVIPLIAFVLTQVPALAGDEGNKEGPPLLQPIFERAGSIYEEVIGGGVSGRVELWQASADLIVARPWFEFDTDSLGFVRHLTGYGPELYRFVFPLESTPEFHAATPALPNYAHNQFIHETVELGFLGLLSYVGLLVALVVTGALHLYRKGRDFSAQHKWLLIALLAAVGGRIVEQMVGIPKVGDLTLFWALLAMFVVLPGVMSAPPTPRPSRKPTGKRSQRVATTAPSLDGQMLARLGIALVAISLVATLTWVRNVNYARADMTVATAAKVFKAGDMASSLRLLEEAIVLAPGVSRYHNYRASVLKGLSGQTTDAAEKIRLTQMALDADVAALQRNPFYLPAVQSRANSTLDLVLLGQTEREPEALQQFENLKAMKPADWRSYKILAAAYLAVERPQRALEAVDTALSFSEGPGTTDKRAGLLLLRGIAYQQLNEYEKAVESVESSLKTGLREDVAEAHAILARLYTALGNDKEAEEHQQRYEALTSGAG